MQHVDRPAHIQALPEPARARRPRVEAEPLRVMLRPEGLNWIGGHRGWRRDLGQLAATLNNDGIVNIPGSAGTGVFSVATTNVGASGTITASADTGSVTLPVTVSICETNPATEPCLSLPAPSVTRVMNPNETPTFGVFFKGSGTVRSTRPATGEGEQEEPTHERLGALDGVFSPLHQILLEESGA